MNERDNEKEELDIIWDRIKAEHQAKKQYAMFQEQKPLACPGIMVDDVLRIFPGASVCAD